MLTLIIIFSGGCEIMQSNISKNLQKIVSELSNLSKYSKSIIRYGFFVYLVILAVGLSMLIYNSLSGYDMDLHITAVSLVKNSFVILAETVIGSILIDYLLKKI